MGGQTGELYPCLNMWKTGIMPRSASSKKSFLFSARAPFNTSLIEMRFTADGVSDLVKYGDKRKREQSLPFMECLL